MREEKGGKMMKRGREERRKGRETVGYEEGGSKERESHTVITIGKQKCLLDLKSGALLLTL